jgi:hypothetical protein
MMKIQSKATNNPARVCSFFISHTDFIRRRNSPGLQPSNEKGERARLGRCEPRPRGSHERVKLIRRSEPSRAFSFSARRAERQPGRLPSPHRFSSRA